jgi:Tfp pilus assembly protein PilF
MAVAGGGLTAGHLVGLADRLTKAEAAARAASDKLAAETQRLSGEHAAALKKLKDANAAEVKKLTDDFAARAKELTDAAAAGTAKLKDEHAAELKKTADKYALDLKKLADENAAAARKLADGYEARLKDLEAAVRAERDRAAAMAAQFKAELGNALSPTQALDLWLPLLAELRRPADADPALAAAGQVLAAAPAGSEDAAKAHAVAGLALLAKGDPAKAKAMLQQATAGPAYKAAAGKPWAKAADAALAAANDPLAPYRKPIDPPAHDPAAAARLLDAGIAAYRAGRYADAAARLDAAVRADRTNALAWYFLGATQWAMGNTDAARDNFRQGAAHEAAGTAPGRTISAALAPIQGPARAALDAARGG